MKIIKTARSSSHQLWLFPLLKHSLSHDSLDLCGPGTFFSSFFYYYYLSINPWDEKKTERANLGLPWKMYILWVRSKAKPFPYRWCLKLFIRHILNHSVIIQMSIPDCRIIFLEMIWVWLRSLSVCYRELAVTLLATRGTMNFPNNNTKAQHFSRNSVCILFF